MSRFSKTDIALLVLAAVYIVMPVDLIPELITGPLGLTDDMAAVAMIAAVIMRSRRTTAGAAPYAPASAYPQAPYTYPQQ
jgi:uncharacterized membrane protein YkvA (DUF1232 family)